MSAHIHQHGITRKTVQGKLFFVVFLNLMITLAEIAGGLLANSLALVSDAVHNFGDTLSVFIAWIAGRISERESNTRKTFGYRRIEILAAFINAAMLMVICFFLIAEGWKRLMHPEPVQGSIMMWVAVLGFAANLASVFLLHKEKKINLNIRASYLHLLGDTLSSVAVILGGILIFLFDIYWIDPLLTVFISLFILKETYEILRETVDILMQATPKGLDLNAVQRCIEAMENVANVHHVHAWNLTDRDIHFECHIDLENDLLVSETKALLDKLTSVLHEQFGISHVTIQFENGHCDDKELVHHRRVR